MPAAHSRLDHGQRDVRRRPGRVMDALGRRAVTAGCGHRELGTNVCGFRSFKGNRLDCTWTMSRELVIRDEDGAMRGVRYDELAPLLLNEMHRQRRARALQDSRIEAQQAHAAAQGAWVRAIQDPLAAVTWINQEMQAALLQLQAKDGRTAKRRAGRPRRGARCRREQARRGSHLYGCLPLP